MSHHCHRCSGVFYWAVLAFEITLFVRSSEGVIKANVTRHEKLLYNDLFKDYNKEIRPVLKESESVYVTFGFALSEILDLDEKNQVLSTNVWIRQRWKDPSLVWNASFYGNIYSININPEHVWTPDIVLYNNVNYEDNGEQYLFKTKVVINSDGTVSWLSPNKLRSFCKIDIHYFPFDTQRCLIQFGSWTHNGLKLNLDFYNNISKADLSIFSKNGEFDLISSDAVRNVIKYTCCPAPFIDLSYTITIKRRPLFYLNNLILPCIVLALLTAVSFMFPPETGERISLVITVLLGMTVFMIVFTEAIPASSEVTPLIGKYFAAVLFEVALCLLATCVPLRLQHLQPGTEMPVWAKIIVFDILGRVMCHRCKGRKRKTSMGSLNNVELDHQYTNDIKLSSSDIIENGYIKENGTTLHRTVNENHRPGALESATNEKPNDLSTIVRHIEKIDRDDHLYAEWKEAISILDRVFFWIFVLTFVISTLVILNGRPMD